MSVAQSRNRLQKNTRQHTHVLAISKHFLRVHISTVLWGEDFFFLERREVLVFRCIIDCCAKVCKVYYNNTMIILLIRIIIGETYYTRHGRHSEDKKLINRSTGQNELDYSIILL